MIRTALPKLTYANVMATGAMVIALGAASGAAVAVSRVTGQQIAKGTITGANVKNASLTGADIKNGSLTGVDVKAHSITAGALTVVPSSALTLPKTVVAVDGADGHVTFGPLQLRLHCSGAQSYIAARSTTETQISRLTTPAVAIRTAGNEFPLVDIGNKGSGFDTVSLMGDDGSFAAEFIASVVRDGTHCTFQANGTRSGSVPASANPPVVVAGT